jgi:lysozyme
LIRHFEGCCLTAYPDPATGGEPWTIGYGHTGPEVHPGMEITQAEADKLLVQDATKVAEQIEKVVRVPLDQCEIDALVCFVFNVGIGNFVKSTLLRKLNAGDYEGAAKELPKWDKAAGKVMAGLTKRREAEKEMFNAVA